ARRGADRGGARLRARADLRFHVRSRLLRALRLHPGGAPLDAAEGLQRVLPLPEIQHLRRDRDGAAPVRGARASVWRSASGGVTCARGFLASGVSAGIKKEGLDLAVISSQTPSAAAAVFTRNRVAAAPVVVSRKHLRESRGRIGAVLINSGCANACTGPRGMKASIASARALAGRLALDPYSVLVCSTGVIGTQLPLGRILRALPHAVAELSPDGGSAALRAIMTTDTREKSAAVEADIAGRTVRIGGMVKGAGMIHPQM